MNTVKDIRTYLAARYDHQDFVTDKSGVQVVELINASFIADEDTIFGEVNQDYVDRELQWYLSRSLNVNDIPGGPPTIWKQVADKDGYINSNYGWCIFDSANGNQFDRVTNELSINPDSRRATMIYTRPQMWNDYNKNGMSDFMCTNAVQYLIRDNKVNAVVQMRSNDAWAGYRNDYAWQKFVLDGVVTCVNKQSNSSYEAGNIYWNVGSLHVYSRQFYLLDHWLKTGQTHITKERYNELYEVA